MPILSCPKGHLFLTERDASCPRCEVPGPDELFAPMDFVGPPLRVINDVNPCFRAADNEARVADHFSKLLEEIVKSAEPVPEKTRKLLSFFVWAAGHKDTGFFCPTFEVEVAVQELGDEAIGMLLRAQRHRPELRPLAEDLLASRFRKADVPIVCDACARDLAEAEKLKHVCQKCFVPFEPSIFDGKIWCRCSACQKMIHESDREPYLALAAVDVLPP